MDQHTSLGLPAGALSDAFAAVRARTERLAAHLSPEDQVIQSMPDTSPTAWHRAHTTWFFEQFILRHHRPGTAPFDEDFNFLFNSYYEALGERQPRPSRGLITKPGPDEIGAYRAHVDAAMENLLQTSDDEDLAGLVRLGLAHEEQHQELLLTDAMHGLSCNPLAWGRRPIAVLPGWREPARPAMADAAVIESGLHDIGAASGGPAFVFDNEAPRHAVFLRAAAIHRALVTNREWLAFIDAGGYRRADLWMSDGWECARHEGWTAPLYWRDGGGERLQMGLGGVAPLDLDAPVRHVSWYEADAFARWSEARLPTEAELEVAHPDLPGIEGHVWQWTSSPYTPYPGFRAPQGALGEYNGKFMINQMVLRGSSFATSPGHSRPTYRNFFHPDKRWQVTGLRLARDL